MEQKIRKLTQALIISGAINIGLLTTFFYFVLKEKQIGMTPTPLVEKVLKKELTNQDVFTLYQAMSFRELLSYLSNKEVIEEGYTKRDLALGCLVKNHFFNIEKALKRAPEQKRKLLFASGEIDLYPHLSDTDYDAVLHYAYTEKWPLTTEGLFISLQKSSQPRDAALEQTFFLTSEFHELFTLFAGVDPAVSQENLLEIITLSDYSTFQKVFDEMKPLLTLEEKRRAFLLCYLSKDSSMAAKILLQVDSTYVTKKMDDQNLLHFLSLLTEKTDYSYQLCIDLLKRPRSDQIWKASAEKLYAYAKEIPPASFTHEQAVARFVPKEEKVVQDEVLKEIAYGKNNSKNQIYLVKEGDSLWKIARKFKVEISEIKKANSLQTEKLRPGKKIIIPKVSKKTKKQSHSKGS